MPKGTCRDETQLIDMKVVAIGDEREFSYVIWRKILMMIIMKKKLIFWKWSAVNYGHETDELATSDGS